MIAETATAEPPRLGDRAMSPLIQLALALRELAADEAESDPLDENT